MIVKAEAVLSGEEVSVCRHVLAGAPWADGRVTAGVQSAQAKRNLQVPEACAQARELGQLVLRALSRHADFTAAALPLRVFPPLFNRYDAGMEFAAHVDNAICVVGEGPARLRTDLSATLFLSAPDEYDGGGLIIENGAAAQPIKLAAGDLILYPANTIHRVAPVTRGARWASFFWVQSMIRDHEARAMLFELDGAIRGLRAAHGELAHLLPLTNLYHNLVRRWAEV